MTAREHRYVIADEHPPPNLADTLRDHHYDRRGHARARLRRISQARSDQPSGNSAPDAGAAPPDSPLHLHQIGQLSRRSLKQPFSPKSAKPRRINDGEFRRLAGNRYRQVISYNALSRDAQHDTSSDTPPNSSRDQ